MRLGASPKSLNGSAFGLSFRAFAAALLCVTAFGLAACGGSDDSDQPSEEQAAAAKEIVALGTQLKQAYDQKDAAAACALLDPQGLKQEFKTKKACAKQVDAAIGQGRGRPEIEFDQVTVDGDHATAVAKSDTGETTYDFVKVDGKWYIDISAQDSDSSQGE
jgi:hypothetical protein